MRSLCRMLVLTAALLMSGVVGAQNAAADSKKDVSKKDVTRAAVRLVLREGLFRGESPEKGSRSNLILFADSSEGRWGLAWGMALDFNQGIHTGIIREASIEPGKASFRFDMLFGKDIWTPGGRGVYEVEVTRDGNSVTGTYKADFRGHTYTGKVEGDILPPRKILDEDHKPIEPGRHPQVLLRKSDLPALRKRLESPLGKAYLQRYANSGDIINLGVLYQITGDKKYAQRAEQIVSGFKKLNGDGFGSGGFGHQMVAVALAYDLCQDAWSDGLRRRVRKKLEWYVPYYQKYLMTSHPNYHPCSNYYGPGRGAAGICALVLWGEKAEKPTEPRNPFKARWNIRPIKADAVGKGVPVVEYEPGQIPDKWITPGALPLDGKQDVLSAMGGYAGARPQVGTTCKYITIDVARKLPKHAMMVFSELDAKAASDKGVDLGKVLDKPRPVRLVLYTVLKFDKEAVISLDPGDENTQAWVGGQEMDEHFYRVSPGLYPLLVVHENKTGKGMVAPSLKKADADAFAARRDLYQRTLDRWEQDVALWEKYDGADPEFIRAVEISRYTILQHFLVGVGKGGFQAETGSYSNIASYFPTVFAELYRDMLGRNASPYDDITHLLPRRMMQHVFTEDGDAKALKLNSGYELGLDWLARGYPIVPDKHKPALLWAWNHVAGVTGPETAGRIFGKNGRGLDQALAFLNYPLDAESKHPSKVMPLHWEASTFGFYAFRNRWKNGDDFVAQVFLKSRPIHGWNHRNAGAWRLWGLGHAWSVGPTSREGHRVQESVVLLPEDKINAGLGGQKEYLETRPDGTAVLVADMNDHYSAKPPRKARKIFDANLLRNPGARIDSGITGKRAFAFDYSGLSGSPCLVVLVDDIKGGGKKQWLFQKSDGKLTVEKAAFTLDKGDANLKATFVAPAKVDVSVPDRTTQWEQHGSNTYKWNAVLATGGDTFFVVMTIQKGDAPAVKIDGKGADATVTVGKRTIRWDGKKIILGEK